MAMSYTWADFERDYFMEHFPKLTPDEQRAALERLSPERRRGLLRSLPTEELLTLLSEEQIRQLRDQLITGHPAGPRNPRRKR